MDEDLGALTGAAFAGLADPARAHGGDVTLTNRSEGGLLARLTLPLASSD